jgi:hypothetical protein
MPTDLTSKKSPMNRLPFPPHLLLLLLLAGAGCSEQLRPWEQLKARHTTTNARVTGTSCADHSSVSYDFRAGGRTYVGKAYGIGRPCESIRTGDLVLVYYNPDMPAINSPMNPERAYEHHKAQTYMPIYFAGFAVLALVISVLSKLSEISAQDALDSSRRRRGNPPS